MSIPIRFKELQIRNVLSFGNQTTIIDLSDPGTTHLQGENLDNDGANGSGKTTILNTLVYVIYDKPLSQISLQRLINATNNLKSTMMEVRLTFDKGIDTYEIYRCRGESIDITLTRNGEDITCASSAETNRLILEIIGISYELFTKIIVFSGDSIPFLLMPVAQQRAQIEELFNITLLSEKAIKLKAIIKATESDAAIQEAVIKEQETQSALFQKQIKNAEERITKWDNDTVNQQANQLQEAKERLEKWDIDTEKQSTKQLKEAEDRITKWDTEKQSQFIKLQKDYDLISTFDSEVEKELHLLINGIKVEETRLTNEINGLRKDNLILETDIKKLTKELSHLVDEKCPYCLQKFEGAAKKIKGLKESIHDKETSINTWNYEINIRNTELTTLLNDKKSALEVMKFGSLEEVLKAESNAVIAENKIKELKNSNNPYIEVLEQLRNQPIPVNPHIEVLEQLKNQPVLINPHIEVYEELLKSPINTVDYTELDKLKKLVEHQQFLLKLLTDKNSFIRRTIISRTIPFLNKRLFYYTRELGLPHVIKFDDDMSCTVVQYGRELDFGNLSSGEKKRVNLSLSLSFRDVLHHLHSHVNCLFVDEIDGGLDSLGVNNIFKLLKGKTREDNLSMWIISHRPEAVGRFDKTVVVRKESGFSRILGD